MKQKYKHDENLLFLLTKAHWKLHKKLNKKFKESGISVTPDQWLILLNLLNQGRMFQSDLARKQFKDKAAVKRLLDQLEHKNLVERKRSSDDLRKKMVDLTPKGLKMIQKMNDVSKQTFLKASRDLSEVELNALKRLIKRIES